MEETSEEFKVVPKLCIEGRAIVVDLSDCEGIRSIATVKKPHMTIVFSEKGYTEAELALARNLAGNWTRDCCANTNGVVTFKLMPWGPRSKLVKGPLEYMGQYIRDSFGQVQTRPLHVELRSRAPPVS